MDIDQVSSIARIHLTASEKKKLTKDAQEVLEAFSVLNSWEMKTVEAATSTVESLRDDVQEDGMSQEDALQNVTYHEDGFLIGPQTTQ